MNEKQMSPLEKLEWAAKTKEITNSYVLELFLDFGIEGVEDMHKAVKILVQNRPYLIVLITAVYSKIQQSGKGPVCEGCGDCKCGKKKFNQDKPFGDAQDKLAQ